MSKTVEPIPGEPFRFHVQSRSRPGLKFLVDLEELDQNGICGCERFEFFMRPKLDKGERGQHLRCWHIEQARDYFLDATLKHDQGRKKQATETIHPPEEDLPETAF